MQGHKGDLTLPKFLLESKSTIHGSLPIKLEWLNKIAAEAINTNRFPAFAMQFVYGDASPKENGSWVAVPDYVFKSLVDYLDDNPDNA